MQNNHAQLNQQGQRFQAALAAQRSAQVQTASAQKPHDMFHVVGAGAALTAAYEQLRNAAENTEEHLLLQNAIRRFYKQLFVSRDDATIRTSGGELITELTLAGYIANDSQTNATAQLISSLALEHYKAYEQLLNDKAVGSDTAYKWTTGTLSSHIESLINDHSIDDIFVSFAYDELSPLVDAKLGAQKTEDERSAALFIAIHQALLKSDNAMIRANLLDRYGIAVTDLVRYKQFNEQIDELIGSDIVSELSRFADRQGAPLRIIRRMMEAEPNLGQLLANSSEFLHVFEAQVEQEYAETGTKISRAVVKSVIFLIITKVIIGVAIEVPYDYWTHGGILWLPLLINLLFPPLYMILLSSTLRLPDESNTAALLDRAQTMLYGDIADLIPRRQVRRHTTIFSAVYVILGFIVFGATMYLLLLLNFQLLHIAIFFVFFSAASFLGFRISRQIRELEIGRSKQSGVTVIRDLIYLPFAVAGQWISEKYSRINLVANIMDMLIELPLKTVLRLVRQWSQFVDDRKDRM